MPLQELDMTAKSSSKIVAARGCGASSMSASVELGRRVFTTPKELFPPFESDAPRLFDFKQTLRRRMSSYKP